MCMVMRGVEKSGASTVSACYLGDMRLPELKAEFLSRTSLR
jgi:GTP cyclohydrolase I